MTPNGFINALSKLDNDTDKLIFGRILESRRISFHELIDRIKKDHRMPEDKVRASLNDLKSRQWIGELPSSNEDLNVFYLKADGLMATGEGRSCFD